MKQILSAANVLRTVAGVLGVMVTMMVNDIRRNLVPRDELMLRLLTLEKEINEDHLRISQMEKEVVELRLKQASWEQRQRQP